MKLHQQKSLSQYSTHTDTQVQCKHWDKKNDPARTNKSCQKLVDNTVSCPKPISLVNHYGAPSGRGGRGNNTNQAQW